MLQGEFECRQHSILSRTKDFGLLADGRYQLRQGLEKSHSYHEGDQSGLSVRL